MQQNNLQATENLPDKSRTGKPARLFFLDNLRSALVILVVVHHAAIIYGAATPFYYVEPPFDEPLAYIILLTFALFNQAWFMGALFLISGYFTPGSYDRKGSGAFLKSRLVRLGIPLIFFIFILSPLSSIGYWQMPSYLTGIDDPLTWGAYPYLLGMGPLWFVALLLIFNICYIFYRMLTENRESSSASVSSPPGYLGLILFTLGLALFSYLWRILIPLGKEVLGFPTLGYLPQYLSFFIVGIIASRKDWLRNIPASKGAVGFAAAVIAAVMLYPLALSGSFFSVEITGPEDFVFMGDGHWQSAVYTLWDSIFAVGMVLAAVTFFRRYLNRESQFGRFLAQQSYAVYIIHTPIVVFLAIALMGVDFGTMLNFALLAVIAVPLCYVIAFLLRKIPGVAKVI